MYYFPISARKLDVSVEVVDTTGALQDLGRFARQQFNGALFPDRNRWKNNDTGIDCMRIVSFHDVHQTSNLTII